MSASTGGSATRKSNALLHPFPLFLLVISMMSEIPARFDQVKDKKIADAELVRIGLIAELDAVSLYEQLAARAKGSLIRKVLMDIAYEEKEHVGEFLELLKRLDPEQVKAFEHGAKEVREMGDERGD